MLALNCFKDKSFEKVYRDTQSLSKTYDAGFFLDSFDYFEDTYSLSEHHVPVIPMNKLNFSDDSKKYNSCYDRWIFSYS